MTDRLARLERIVSLLARNALSGPASPAWKDLFDAVSVPIAPADESALDQRREIETLRRERDAHAARNRYATQAIVEAIGSVGPESIEDAVPRLLAHMAAEVAKAEERGARWALEHYWNNALQYMQAETADRRASLAARICAEARAKGGE